MNEKHLKLTKQFNKTDSQLVLLKSFLVLHKFHQIYM